ncbi:MAG: glycosyltransferase family 39 protein [Planctomycetaceae bacterium]|nr:glycosyltransferase family 39 protein [Planctomycetaceae bacterium]
MSPTDHSSARAPLWRETEFWLLMLLTALVYVPRLADQTIRGEESRWATVAQQMLATGDYLIPRQQGAPFPDRPPLHCWTIAACMSVFGPTSLWGIRLPSVLAMFGTGTVIYAYSRRFLAPLGALAAGCAFATMAQTMQLGRLAESDSLFTFLLTSSLLVWHSLYESGRSRLLLWSVGFALAALATLAKGPQAPVYFGGVTAVYLLLVQRDWRTLLSWQYLCGGALFVAILGAWQIPFAMAVGGQGVLGVYTQEGHLIHRFTSSHLGGVVRHVATYPFKLLLATLPWSLLLPAYLGSWIYRTLGAARRPAAFVATCLAVTFPTCWFAPDAVTRYYLSLFPCLAILVGIVVQRCAESSGATWWMASWRRYVSGSIALIGVTPLTLIVIAGWGQQLPRGVAQPLAWLALIVVAAGIAVAALVIARRGADQPRLQRQAVLAVAGFCGLIYVGVVLNVVVAQSTNPAGDIAQLKQQLPPHAQLTSLGPAHHMFNFYFAEPVRLVPRLLPAERGHEVGEYFCFAQNRDEPQPIEIPFDWEPVTTISCDRTRRPEPVDMLVIGRRKPPLTAARAIPQRETTSEQPTVSP